MWVAACLLAYVPLVLFFGAAEQVVLGPWSVLPAVLAAWAYGARLGVLVALVLAPVHVYLAARDSVTPSLTLPLFASAVNAFTGGVTGFLFERLRGAQRFQKECEQRYERASRGANDGLLEWDLRTDRLYVSQRFGEMLGLGERAVGRLRSQTWLELVHEEDRPALDAAIQALRDGAVKRLDHEHRLRCADGSDLWVELRGVLTETDGSEVITL